MLYRLKEGRVRKGIMAGDGNVGQFVEQLVSEAECAGQYGVHIQKRSKNAANT